MKIRNVIHKGLRRFIEDDVSSGLPPAVGPKVRKIVSFLQDMDQESELRTVPTWNAHQMTGDRRGTWSLSVTKELAHHVPDRAGGNRNYRPQL